MELTVTVAALGANETMYKSWYPRTSQSETLMT